MKTFVKLFTILAVFATGFASCGDGDKDKNNGNDDAIQKSDPKIVKLVDFTLSGNNLEIVLKITCGDPDLLKSVTAECYYNENSIQKIEDIGITPLNNKTWEVEISFPENVNSLRVEKIKVSASTVNGGSASETFIIPKDEEKPEVKTPLCDPISFPWVRTGNEETVYDPVGIKFNSEILTTEAGTFAPIIRNTAESMVILFPADIEKIETKEDLVSMIESYPEEETISRIRMDKSISYNFGIGVIVNNVYYLVVFTRATVETVGDNQKVTISTTYQF